MIKNSRFIKALKNQKVDITPVWCMRQAGRYMKAYRKIREKHSFLTMVKTPELAAEITLQPIRKFDFDAAIIFSDILVVTEAMGLSYTIKEGYGPIIKNPVSNEIDIKNLRVSNPNDTLRYVMEAISLVKKELSSKPLIGFSASPWTLAVYMVEGKSPRDFLKIKGLFYSDNRLFHKLMDKIAKQITEYLVAKVKAGVDALQIFDTWGGVLSKSEYPSVSLKYINRIIKNLRRKVDVPIILYVKGGFPYLEEIKKSEVDCVSLDWMTSLKEARKILGKKIAVQGNMDPAVLFCGKKTIEREVKRIISENNSRKGHIFNLGHGILPRTPEKNVKIMVDTIRRFKIK